MASVLLATDADWIFDEVDAALVERRDHGVPGAPPATTCSPAIKEVEPDLVILDLQIGNMGGMATCMTIRHEEGADRLPITAVLMLLDRAPTCSWPSGPTPTAGSSSRSTPSGCAGPPRPCSTATAGARASTNERTSRPDCRVDLDEAPDARSTGRRLNRRNPSSVRTRSLG